MKTKSPRPLAKSRGLIDGEARAAGISNLIEHDAVLKEAMGFDEAHFTRLWQVCGRFEGDATLTSVRMRDRKSDGAGLFTGPPFENQPPIS